MAASGWWSTRSSEWTCATWQSEGERGDGGEAVVRADGVDGVDNRPPVLGAVHRARPLIVDAGVDQARVVSRVEHSAAPGVLRRSVVSRVDRSRIDAPAVDPPLIEPSAID